MTKGARGRAPDNLTLDGVVAYWALKEPEGCALCWESGGFAAVTWCQFEAAIAEMSDRLRPQVAPNSAVAVVCFDGPLFHVLINAIWRLGGGVLLIDRTWGQALTSDLVALVGCTVLFASDATVRQDCGGLSWSCIPEPLERASALVPDSRTSVDAGLDRVAIYATTSGTTDNPKCVAISHRQIRAAYQVCFQCHDWSARQLCACLFDVNSLGVLGINFLLQREVGVGTVIFPSFALSNIARSWESLLKNDCIGFVYLVPPLVRLLNTLPATRPRGVHVLAFCSAAPVTESELRELEEKFPLRVYNAYGLTELTFAVFFGARNVDDRASDSIGQPRGIRARIVDTGGKPLEGPGRGELQIAGPMLTSGYLNNNRATDETWHEGWLKTGDLAERDGQDKYYIRGRIKDVVLRGGYTYYLHELEHYLRRMPSVIDACAFKGRELPSGDELCVVVQVSDSSTSPDGIAAWIRHQVGAHKVPNVIHIWHEALPRNSNGKVLRRVISEMHHGGRMLSRCKD